ncbi:MULTISPECIES: hypothetical protein [Pseudomonadaceae]|uniref:Uncharacterized protein n=1 Tax=Metapseudomonas otitidis TaxID=319939 RepID=A0A7X3HA52_9GAMM|nr:MULTISPECIES: hypothetical protein [Pseudomonas]MCP1617006.1 hypothetical protein [Pseudomonas otitidis]MWK58213.1 hypothetical protein [Pseudomonas otitidis]
MNKDQHPNADDAFEPEFMTWWEKHGQYCRSGGGDYERSFAFEAWRHLYPKLMQARAARSAPHADGMADAYVGAREDLAIWKHRALEAEQKVRVLDQRIDQLVLEAQGETRMGEPHIAPPAAVPAELTNVRCMCGDEYPHDSYGAGFIAGSGMCENCDAAIPAKEPPAAGVPEGWQPMETAPKDGTLLRLLVEFEDHPIDDGAGPFATVGTNYRDNTGEDAWQIVGWCWEQDRFIDGVGTPIGWLPMLAATPTPPASEQQRAVFAIPDMDEHLLQILGRPNFRCAHIAQVLRLDGAEIRRKAEDEQAVVIHWMLTLYLAHGAKWWEVATEEVKRIQSEHMAKGEGV